VLRYAPVTLLRNSYAYLNWAIMGQPLRMGLGRECYAYLDVSSLFLCQHTPGRFRAIRQSHERLAPVPIEDDANGRLGDV
jgi:hypothetical protein